MLKAKIMAYLQDIQIAAIVPEIAHAVGADPRDVQNTLHDLDDEDLVIMRNGYYLASRKGMAYKTPEREP